MLIDFPPTTEHIINVNIIVIIILLFCTAKKYVIIIITIIMPNKWRTIISLVHKILLHGRHGKGTAESFSR